ncbi:MAG: HD domain-containing protein [Xanthobacteraceae bacterium]|nr:HD domain-containing protein [Xanthobacteraceae bacterium]
MLVYFITDEPTKLPAVRAMLEPQYNVVPRLLGNDSAQASARGVLMVDVDLRQMVRVEQVRLTLQQMSSSSEKLFVVHNQVPSMVAQAYALGATVVISRAKEAAYKLAQIEDAEKAAQRDAEAPSSGGDSPSAAFASMFSALRNGRPINILDAEHATAQIVDRVKRDGLVTWLDEVRRYHEGTFQHCLLVTGVAAGFGLEIGFNSADVARLGIAATLHDIGKARIPLSILDKPGHLDPAEDAIMRRHPEIGYDLLKDVAGMTPEILDGVRHHHEYLDGSGYPDGLTAPQISDLVRLLTISDIFAALIEARPYRAPTPRHTAYQILCDMGGKLEGSLVKAFAHVALKS